MNKDLQKLRYVGIDYSRFIAIMLVIVCHCSEFVYEYNIDYFNQTNMVNKFLMIVFLILGRMGVPIFIQISGFLILKKDFENKEQIITFWKKSLLPLIYITEIWIIINYIFSIFVLKENNSILNLVKEMLFLKYPTLPHMWYMPMIIGMYFFIPLISRALKGLDTKIIGIVTFVSFLIIIAGDRIAYLVNIIENTNLIIGLDMHFSGGVYGIYLFIGYLVFSKSFKNVKTSLISLILISSFSLLIIFQYILLTREYNIFVWYNSPLLMICSTCIFELLNRIKKEITSKFIKKVVQYSFAIYLVHYPLLILIQKYIKFNVPVIEFIVYLIMVFICSYLFIAIIKKLHISKWLFSNKC